MAELVEQVGLDLSQATADAENFAQGFAESLNTAVALGLEGLSAQLLGIGSDLADILAAAATDIPVTVLADTTEAQAQVDEVVAKADSEHAVIAVDADTSDAVAAIDEVAASAESATVALDSGGASAKGFADSTSLISGAAGLAVGNVSGLGEAATGLGLGSAAAVGGVAALGAGVFALFNKGLDATSALQRFNFIVGDMADKVLHVNVGTLNTQLDELAIKLGTDDEALRDASASVFQFSVNSGASGDAAATFTNQVDALAARAVALKPALGDVATVAEGMIRAFASGRDRALVPYQIVLDKTAISARALEIAQAAGRDEINRFDNAAAVAQLSVEKYGNTLNDTVAKGAQNAAIQQRSLKEQLDNVLEAAGKPLVTPFLDAFKDAIPAVAALAQPLATIAVDLIPVLVTGLEAVTPPLQLVADIFDAVPPPIVVATAAALLFAPALNLVTSAANAGILSLGALGSEVTLFAGATGLAATSMGVAIPVVGTLFASIAIGKALFPAVKSGLEELGVAFGTDYAAAAKKADAATMAVVHSTREGLLPAFHDLLAKIRDANEDEVPRLTLRLDAFRRVAEASPAAAISLRDALHVTGTEADAFDFVLGKILAKQRDGRQASQDQAAALSGLAAAYQTPLEAAKAFSDELDRQKKIQTELENLLLGLPGALDNYAQAQLDLNQAQRDYNDALAGGDPDKIARARIALDRANQGLASSTIALDKAQKDLNTDLSDPDAVNMALAHLHDLANQYPAAAAALAPFIKKLEDQKALLDYIASIPPIHTEITVDYGVYVHYSGEEELARQIAAQLHLDVVPTHAQLVEWGYLPAAHGLVVAPQPGGTLVNVGEAGSTEVILSAGNTDAENQALLAKAGLGRLMALPQPTIYAPAAAAFGLATATSHDDHSIHIGRIDASGQPDPTRIAILAGRRFRAEMAMASQS